MSEKTPKCIDCGSSPDFVVRLASGRWKCMDCRTEWGENWDWNDDPRTKGLQTNLVRLTSERDEAVRVAGELRAALEVAEVKAAFAEEIRRKRNHAHTVYWWAEYLEEFDRRYDSLTASTGGSSDEPQKEIRE